MESINNIASAATKAVWGEEQARKEPLSGVKGDVAKGEPFDAGNLESARQEQVENSFEGRSENVPALQPVEENAAPRQSKTDNVGRLPGRSFEIRDTGENISSTRNEYPEPNRDGMSQDSMPFEGLDFRAQEPVAADTDWKNPVKPETKDFESFEESDASSKATGQEYVRSTGLAADGGDFDATKPGAGREAERLMEEKGLHPNEDDPHAASGKDKPSLGERIKAKLHKH